MMQHILHFAKTLPQVCFSNEPGLPWGADR